MSVSESDVMAALSGVIDPELHISLVQAGMVKNLQVVNNDVKVKIELTTPACPMKGKIQADVELALKAVKGIGTFAVEWGARVRPAPVGMGKESLLPQVKNVILVGAGKGGEKHCCD